MIKEFITHIRSAKFYAAILGLIAGAYLVSNLMGYRYFNSVQETHTTEQPTSRSHYYRHK